jgi:uncharacterized protein YbbC (DUF1343 family)
MGMLQKSPHASPHLDASSWLPPPYEYDFERLSIDIITGDESIRKGLEQRKDLDEMEKSWQEKLEGFLMRRKQYLLY